MGREAVGKSPGDGTSSGKSSYVNQGTRHVSEEARPALLAAQLNPRRPQPQLLCDCNHIWETPSKTSRRVPGWAQSAQRIVRDCNKLFLATTFWGGLFHSNRKPNSVYWISKTSFLLAAFCLLTIIGVTYRDGTLQFNKCLKPSGAIDHPVNEEGIFPMLYALHCYMQSKSPHHSMYQYHTIRQMMVRYSLYANTLKEHRYSIS